jgi:hypothetical protein
MITNYQIRIDGGDPVDVGNVLTYTLTGLSIDSTQYAEIRSQSDDGTFSRWRPSIRIKTRGIVMLGGGERLTDDDGEELYTLT